MIRSKTALLMVATTCVAQTFSFLSQAQPAAGKTSPKTSRATASKTVASPGFITLTEPPYNADPTGVGDATAAINDALASGKPILCSGTFKVTGAIAYNVPRGGGVSIQGAGRQLCKFVDSYSGGDMFSLVLPASDQYATPQVVKWTPVVGQKAASAKV